LGQGGIEDGRFGGGGGSFDGEGCVFSGTNLEDGHLAELSAFAFF